MAKTLLPPPKSLTDTSVDVRLPDLANKNNAFNILTLRKNPLFS